MRPATFDYLTNVGPIQEVTSSDSRIRIDPTRTDRFGNPVAKISGSIHAEDVLTVLANSLRITNHPIGDS